MLHNRNVVNNIFFIFIQEVMLSIIADPKVISSFHHNHGEPGYRIHQGDRLRDSFLEMTQEQVEWSFD